MSVNSILQTGVQGIQNATQSAEIAAREIVRASSGTSSANVVEAMVDLKLYERSVQASSQVVKTADEVLGSILDIMV